MARRSKTAPSTPRLSEFARRFTYPAGIEKTVWPRVEAKGRELGLGFDWWQSQLGTVCLGYGADGKYVATVGGVGMSIPRQVGKTYFVLAMLVILCILFPGLQVVWTAHHLRTSTKTFTALRGICRRRKVAPHVRAMRSANGEQQVEFVNGSTIMFGARSQGFGRGFDEIDVEVFDEAQILDTKALEDMIAATNQARHEHGALLFFMGTPPRPTDPSDAFTERRNDAWRGDPGPRLDDDAIWVEIGAPPKSDPNDRSVWPAMNPSFPSRTPLESLLRLRRNLKDESSWNREGRGVWDEDHDGGDLPSTAWLGLKKIDAERGGQVAFGVDVAEDRTAWIGVAWWLPGDKIHVELVPATADEEDATAMPAHRLAERAKEVADVWAGPVVGPKSLEAELLRARVAWVVPATSTDFAAACGEFSNRIQAGTIHHGNQGPLNDAVKVAKWRGPAGARSFQLAGMPEVGPLAAAVRAVHGLISTPPPPPPVSSDSTTAQLDADGITAGLSSMTF